MVDMAFFRGGLVRWLPPSVSPVDEAVLLRRCWELLVLDRPGTARLAVLGRAPLCRTVLLPQENTAAPLRAQQVVGCGLSYTFFHIFLSATLMARALLTLAIMLSGIIPIYCFNLCLSIVRICSSRITESLSNPS